MGLACTSLSQRSRRPRQQNRPPAGCKKCGFAFFFFFYVEGGNKNEENPNSVSESACIYILLAKYTSGWVFFRRCACRFMHPTSHHMHPSKQCCCFLSNQTVTEPEPPSRRPPQGKKHITARHFLPDDPLPTPTHPLVIRERVALCLSSASPRLGSECPAPNSIRGSWRHQYSSMMAEKCEGCSC